MSKHEINLFSLQKEKNDAKRSERNKHYEKIHISIFQMDIDGEVEVEADLPISSSSTVLPATTSKNGSKIPMPVRVILPSSCKCLFSVTNGISWQM
jgi:hypothetical protein